MTDPAPLTTTVPVKPAGPTAGVTTEPFVIPVTSVESPFNRKTETSPDEGETDGNKEIVVVDDPPPVLAVMVAACALGTAPEVAVNVAEVAPAGADTEAGTTTDVLEDDKDTTVPPPGALCERVTVQLAVEPPAAGEHCKDDGVTALTSATVVCAVDPFSEAVTVTVWPMREAAAEALKVATVDPAMTFSDAGTVRDVELELKATVVAAADAAVSVTVQVVDADGPSGDGLQTIVEIVKAGGPIIPPPPETVTWVPSVAAPIALERLMAVGVFTWPSVTETVAATPLAMVEAPMPTARQVYPVAVLRQVSVLPAAVRVGPGLAVKL